MNLQRTAQPKPSRFDREVSKFKRQQAKAKAKRQETRRDRVKWALVCLSIFMRDQGRCRVCQRGVKPLHGNPEQRAETHHIQYRSAGGSDDSTNLVLLCGSCHALEHAHRLQIRGNGDGVVTVTLINAETGSALNQAESPCPTVDARRA
jgi:5-methylcytosine-specific restriction endonuclease McrA